MTQEINFAMHLGIHAVVIDLPQSPRIENFARILAQYFHNMHSSKFILRVEVPSSYEEAEDTYSRYLQLKQLCGHHGGLQLILELGADLPPWEAFSKRWIGDKIFGV